MPEKSRTMRHQLLPVFTFILLACPLLIYTTPTARDENQEVDDLVGKLGEDAPSELEEEDARLMYKEHVLRNEAKHAGSEDQNGDPTSLSESEDDEKELHKSEEDQEDEYSSEEHKRNLFKRQMGRGNNPSARRISNFKSTPRKVTMTRPRTVCEDEPRVSEHSTFKCLPSSGCSAVCDSGFQFPNGYRSLIVTCPKDRWVAQGTEYDAVPDCVPIPKKCELLRPSDHSRVNCPDDSICEARCHKNYTFPQDEKTLEATCNDGKWIFQGSEITTFPDCVLICPNLAEDVPNAQLSCDGSGSSKTCTFQCDDGFKLPIGGREVSVTCINGVWTDVGYGAGNVPSCVKDNPQCSGLPDSIPNSEMSCVGNAITPTCTEVCLEGYKLPNGETQLKMQCINGEWTRAGFDLDNLPACEKPVPACGGELLITPENVSVECESPTKCQATCSKGYRFPSGTSRLEVNCRKNKWVMEGFHWTKLPNCVEELRSNAKCNGTGYLVFPNVGAYKVNTTYLTWDEAQKACIHEGSYLVVINTKAELAVIKELMAAHHIPRTWTYAHVGFSDMGQRGVWVTALGEKLKFSDYSKWAPNNPSKYPERCGAVDHMGRLHDIYCTNEEIFICEKI